MHSCRMQERSLSSGHLNASFMVYNNVDEAVNMAVILPVMGKTVKVPVLMETAFHEQEEVNKAFFFIRTS